MHIHDKLLYYHHVYHSNRKMDADIIVWMWMKKYMLKRKKKRMYTIKLLIISTSSIKGRKLKRHLSVVRGDGEGNKGTVNHTCQ